MIKKILIIMALMSVLVLSGCSPFPNSCKPQERFCASKNMTYECGNHKDTIFWCIDCCENKVPFTLKEFNEFYYGSCGCKAKAQTTQPCGCCS